MSETQPPIRPVRRLIAVGLATALALGAAPAQADRSRDRDRGNAVAGALVLGLVGVAIAQQQRPDRETFPEVSGEVLRLTQTQLTRNTLTERPQIQSQSRLTEGGAIYITPRREIYYGPGGADPQVQLAPLTGMQQGTLGIVAPVKPATTASNGVQIVPLFQTGGGVAGPDHVPNPVNGGFVPSPVVVPWVETRPLDPTGGAAPDGSGITLPPGLITGTATPAPARDVIPAHCLQTFDQGGENRRLYGPECLAANTTFARDLPLSCAVTVQTLGRFISGYDPACLRAAGYQIAGS